MAQVINTNIASFFSQRSLNFTNSGLNTALERLSSGKRINSAKDDAAGIAIASRFTAQIRGTNQGARNSADAISLAQTAEGAMDEISSNLQRIRELAVQSANGTNSLTDRQALQSEVDQLTQEISRNVDATEFNGIKLLNTSADLKFQVGAGNGSDSSITVSTQSLAPTTAAAQASESIMNIISAGDNYLTTSNNVMNYFSSLTGIEIGGWDSINDVIRVDTIALGSQVGNIIMVDATPLSAASMVTDSTAQASLGALTISATFEAAWSTAHAWFAQQQVIDRNSTALMAAPAIAAAQGVRDTLGGGSGGLNSYNTINITSSSAAMAAIDLIDNDLTTINTTQATFGAVQNRFESVIRNNENLSENLSASRSRIEDADFAKETANLTKFQILQQAGMSVLSQANALPQSALSLLG